MLFWLATVPSSVAQVQQVKINDLARNAGKFVGKKVTVQGRLVFAGRNYFTDPRFVLADEQGETVPVSAWAPLEIPPPMPGEKVTPADRPRTMSDYLGKRFSITGIFSPNPVRRENELAVESAVEIAEDQSARNLSAPVLKRSPISAGKTSPPRTIPAGERPDQPVKPDPPAPANSPLPAPGSNRAPQLIKPSPPAPTNPPQPIPNATKPDKPPDSIAGLAPSITVRQPWEG
jgi:hypothetical protein